jgi:uncharacterized membrane protein YeaQ/YmgE (transglycosylase-associated protein family)
MVFGWLAAIGVAYIILPSWTQEGRLMAAVIAFLPAFVAGSILRDWLVELIHDWTRR